MKITATKWSFFYIIFLLYITNYQVSAQEFTSGELKLIKECKPGILGVFDRKEMREFILLMNLARQDGALCNRYILKNYGQSHTESKAINELASGKYEVNSSSYGRDKARPILKPSLGLKLSAFYHAVGSGLIGSLGHQMLGFRVLMGFNFVPFLSTGYGENCEYGSKKGIDIFVNLMNSQGHKENILSNRYCRVGVARSFHISRYRKNTVSVFSGKKLWQ